MRQVLLWTSRLRRSKGDSLHLQLVACVLSHDVAIGSVAPRALTNHCLLDFSLVWLDHELAVRVKILDLAVDRVRLLHPLAFGSALRPGLRAMEVAGRLLLRERHRRPLRLRGSPASTPTPVRCFLRLRRPSQLSALQDPPGGARLLCRHHHGLSELAHH